MPKLSSVSAPAAEQRVDDALPSSIPVSRVQRTNANTQLRSRPAPRARPPALLADASWYGTLAAVRGLGEHGVKVTLACDAVTAPARWSRYVTRSVRCPNTKDADSFLEWLVLFGRAEPGHVLYPTSDESAWLCSAHADELSQWYHLYSPPIAALVRVLDKLELAQAALANGLATPEVRAPETEAEVERAGRELGFPLYLKPRAQVLGKGLSKGVRIEKREALLPAWRSLQRAAAFDPRVSAYMPGASLPILQAYRGRAERIYTLDGFIDESGEIYESIACAKLLQRPRGSGPGIIFEHAELDHVVDAGLRRLLSSLGFYGVFDAEFLEHDGQKLLIDLNPRFYNHMAFEIERGLNLPFLAYLAASGDRAGLAAEAQLDRSREPRRSLYVHRLSTSLMLRAQTWFGSMSRGERASFSHFLDSSRETTTDPVHRADDPRPRLAEYASELSALVRHPRSFVGKLRSPG